MVSEFFRTSTTWVVDYLYEGRARRWFKAIDPKVDATEQMSTLLRDLYGKRARLMKVRKATEEEELQYLRGEETKNAYCPTVRTARSGGERGRD